MVTRVSKVLALLGKGPTEPLCPDDVLTSLSSRAVGDHYQACLAPSLPFSAQVLAGRSGTPQPRPWRLDFQAKKAATAKGLQVVWLFLTEVTYGDL